MSSAITTLATIVLLACFFGIMIPDAAAEEPICKNIQLQTAGMTDFNRRFI